jgi:hypothetical protein
LLGTSTEVGPISEKQLVDLARSGRLKLETFVSSPTRTQGNWLRVQQIPGLVQNIQAGESERRLAKQQQEQKAAAARDAMAAQREAERQQQAAANALQAQQLAQVSDCQDINVVNGIFQKVQGILTSNEQLQFIAVQQKPVLNISPDAVIATSKRLIFFRPKVLGRFEFEDYQWFDLFNAHLKQGMLGSTFPARHVSGQIVSMDYLSKTGAQMMYRLAQEREEQARLTRHQLHVDTIRAGAMQVNVGQPITAPVQGVPTPAPQGDLVQRMQTLKTMLDQGLITPAEFESRKQAILASV